jgi:flavin reductase (DIM6/NTAB) family NADH-FMN oxidoreductase RutF
MINSDDLRFALGKYITGVTIVTCNSDNGPIGITANSFSSLSLSPPLVLWAPAKASKRHDTFLEAEKFIVHIASENQIELCKSFSKSAYGYGESELIWTYNDEGDAFIENCSARFECIKYNHFDGGDHSIIVGEVKKFESTDQKPLVYLGGDYQKL